MHNRTPCKRTFIFIIFGERYSKNLGHKGVIHTQSNIKHIQNMYNLVISKHEMPQHYDFENLTFVVIEIF